MTCMRFSKGSGNGCVMRHSSVGGGGEVTDGGVDGGGDVAYRPVVLRGDGLSCTVRAVVSSSR